MSTRQIGPVGTTLRVIGAVGLLVIAVIDFGRDVPPGGSGWWDVAAVVLAFPIVALASSLAVNALFQRLGTDTVRRVSTTWSSEQAAATTRSGARCTSRPSRPRTTPAASFRSRCRLVTRLSTSYQPPVPCG